MTVTLEFERWTDELDQWIGRLTRADAQLVLEQESALWWIVVDRANGGEVMMRADRELCVRFMRAFVVRHPEASFALPERGMPGKGPKASEPRNTDPGVAVRVGPMPRSESASEHSWRVAHEATANVLCECGFAHRDYCGGLDVCRIAGELEERANVLPFPGAA